MTHPNRDINTALNLHARGLSSGAIAERLGIPRGTVKDWMSGRLPHAWNRWDHQCCAECGRNPHRFEELPGIYSYLLGLYLGDGSIATHPRAFKLRIMLDARYPGIIAEAISAMGRVLPASKVNTWSRPKGDVEVYAYSMAWPCLFPQHGPGKKHLRRIRLADWQEVLVRREPHLLLRGLIHSDGCRFMNTGRGWSYPRYSFTNLSPDIRQIFRDACDLLGLHWTNSGAVVYVSRKADVDTMDRFVGPKA
jgi:hypothetical protein